MPTSYSTEGRSVRAVKSGHRLTAVRGFSLIEALIVVSIIFIAAAVVIPTASTAIRSVRLSSSGTRYADLLQQARVLAVRNDTYYTVISVPATSSAAGTAFLDLNGNGTYQSGEPMMVFAQNVTPTLFSSGPALSNLESMFLPPGTASLQSVTDGQTAAGPTFGPRGLPCKPSATGLYTTCPYLTPTSYITFVQSTDGGTWEAVTVTPAGRIREWRYDGSTWSPLD